MRAPHGYDLVKIISTIYVKAQKKISADDFIRRLEELKNYEGASGLLSVNATKNIENTCVWQVVEGGNFSDLTTEKLNQFRIMGIK